MTKEKLLEHGTELAIKEAHKGMGLINACRDSLADNYKELELIHIMKISREKGFTAAVELLWPLVDCSLELNDILGDGFDRQDIDSATGQPLRIALTDLEKKLEGE